MNQVTSKMSNLSFSPVLESWLDHSGELEPPDPLSRLPQLKQRIRRLLCDLCTVRRLSVWRWNVSLLNHWTLTVNRDGLEHKVCSQDAPPLLDRSCTATWGVGCFFGLTDWLKRVFTFHDRTGTFLLPAGRHLVSNHVMAGLMWCFMSCCCPNASFLTEKLSLYRHQTKMIALNYYFIAAM